ncbi:hypothetical protein V2J09_014372 [Rumex salicifolius]
MTNTYILMEARDIVDIPDTPDRVGRRKSDGRDGCSLISCSEDSCLVGEDGVRKKGRIDNATPSQCEGKFLHRRRGISISEPSSNGRSSVVLAQRHSSEGESASLFRKVGNKACNPDGRHNIDSQHADNSKDVHLKCSSKLVFHPEHNTAKIVIGGNTHQAQKASSQCVLSESNASKSEDLLVNNSVYHSEDPLNAKSHPNKGKAKINYDMYKAVPRNCDRKNRFATKDDGSEQKFSRQVSNPVDSGTSSSFIGKKRLVRNGCISPLNIAKVKQASESSSNGNKDFKCASTIEVAKVDPSIVIDVDRELSSGRIPNQVKGKDIVSHLSSGEHDTRPRDLNKSLASETDPTMDQRYQANTFKRPKKNDLPLSSQDNTEEVIFIGSRSKPSSSVSHAERNRHRPCAVDAVIEIDEHSPNIASSNSQSDNGLAVKDRQVEADEMLARELQEQLYHEAPEIRSTERDLHLAWTLQQEENVQQAPSVQQAPNMQQPSHVQQVPRNRNIVNPRESHHAWMLQQEVNVQQAPVNPRDSHLAWMLQQEENAQQAPRRRNVLNARGSSSLLPPRRQARSQLLQNRLRRGAQPQIPARLSRLRTTMQRSYRLFPSEMDLQTRIEMLEALEAVVSDDMDMVNQLLNPDRDFTESDYDMLLALDENNHEHLGASNAQISNLPESIVQTSSNDSCTICLEEPSIGETIRHLPCLHKFHKECIDSWLRRKRSCPICKSDIT